MAPSAAFCFTAPSTTSTTEPEGLVTAAPAGIEVEPEDVAAPAPADTVSAADVEGVGVDGFKFVAEVAGASLCAPLYLKCSLAALPEVAFGVLGATALESWVDPAFVAAAPKLQQRRLLS